MAWGCVLYGTPSRSILAMTRNSSAPPRLEPLPLPKESLPGSLRASAMNSATVFTGNSFFTITICAPSVRPQTGVKFFTGS